MAKKNKMQQADFLEYLIKKESKKFNFWITN